MFLIGRAKGQLYLGIVRLLGCGHIDVGCFGREMAHLPRPHISGAARDLGIGLLPRVGNPNPSHLPPHRGPGWRYFGSNQTFSARGGVFVFLRVFVFLCVCLRACFYMSLYACARMCLLSACACSYLRLSVCARFRLRQ